MSAVFEDDVYALSDWVRLRSPLYRDEGAPPDGHYSEIRFPAAQELPGPASRNSDGFRHFLLEQRTAFATMDLERFAATVAVPLGTLKHWLREQPAAERPAQPAPAPTTEMSPQPVQIQTVLHS